MKERSRIVNCDCFTFFFRVLLHHDSKNPKCIALHLRHTLFSGHCSRIVSFRSLRLHKSAEQRQTCVSTANIICFFYQSYPCRAQHSHTRDFGNSVLNIKRRYRGARQEYVKLNVVDYYVRFLWEINMPILMNGAQAVTSYSPNAIVLLGRPWCTQRNTSQTVAQPTRTHTHTHSHPSKSNYIILPLDSAHTFGGYHKKRQI